MYYCGKGKDKFLNSKLFTNISQLSVNFFTRGIMATFAG